MLPRPSMLGWAWLVSWPALAGAGLLGAGEGEGSCAAPPFRAHYVKWPHGCPAFAPCCTEYGFCRPLVSADPRQRGSSLQLMCVVTGGVGGRPLQRLQRRQ